LIKLYLFAFNKFGIHFSTSPFDLTNLTFNPRVYPNLKTGEGSFTTKLINYNYDPTSSDNLMRIHHEFKKVIVKDDALDYIRVEIVKALISANDCNFMYLCGKGNTGKSSLMNSIKASFTEVYCKDIPSDTFTSDQLAQRFLNTVEPQHRFLFCNDPPKKRLSSGILKALCDGVVHCKVLYKNGSIEVRINAKLYITANSSISFDDNDSGIRRRIMYYQCKNRFSSIPVWCYSVVLT
jgi:hypothetical protein